MINTVNVTVEFLFVAVDLISSFVSVGCKSVKWLLIECI